MGEMICGGRVKSYFLLVSLGLLLPPVKPRTFTWDKNEGKVFLQDNHIRGPVLPQTNRTFLERGRRSFQEHEHETLNEVPQRHRHRLRHSSHSHQNKEPQLEPSFRTEAPLLPPSSSSSSSFLQPSSGAGVSTSAVPLDPCYHTSDVLCVVALTCVLNFSFVALIWCSHRKLRRNKKGKKKKRFWGKRKKIEWGTENDFGENLCGLTDDSSNEDSEEDSDSSTCGDEEDNTFLWKERRGDDLRRRAFSMEELRWIY